MKAKLLFMAFALCATFYSARVFSQEYQNGVFWIMFSQNEILARNETETTDERINNIFKRYDVYKLRQVFPYAKKEENRRIFEVMFNYSSAEEFINALFVGLPELIEDTYRLSAQIELLYEPTDWHWVADKMWHLRKIQADSAWEMERGSEEVKIAIIDDYFDPTHHDLKTEFLFDFDPIDSVKYLPEIAGLPLCQHGTTVAGFASGQTTEEGQIQPDSALNCSIGFNTKILAYRAFNKDLLETGLHASTKMGADIISLSVAKSCNPNNGKIISRSTISEILDNGTLIVQGAGNGFCKGCYFNGTEYKMSKDCNQPDDFVEFSSFYPYSPEIDERIIVVTGVNHNDSLTRKVWDSFTNQYKYSTFSYYPEVDVAAPGYDMMGLQTTMSQQVIGNDTLILPRPSFAFWHGFGGTSFATPIVSGLASLIKSRNPILPVEELIRILKSSVDSVSDAQEYLHPVTHESRTGTGRINAYKAIKNTPEPENYEICDSTEHVWNGKKYIKDYIVICPGSTLRIKSDVYFSNLARIKVERGGRLIIDGGRLTGSPNRMWQGIVAYSKPEAPQNPIYQSVVTLINGGTIENAIVGIATDDPMPHNSPPTKARKGGAIIISNDGVFRNCNVAIEMLPYEFNSISSFKRTLFEINASIAPNSIEPDCFIRMRNVSGVRFNGCDFRSQNFLNVTGIKGINAGFIVEGACNGISMPCNDITPSVFENLKYGIHLSGIASAKVVRIENTIFEADNTGVYLSGISNPCLRYNQFFTRVHDSDNERGADVGLYLDGCTNYTVESNDFIKTGTFGQITTKVGIVVNNSGSANNELFLNNFSNLDYGILAQGINRSTDGLTGLEIRCNNFTNCMSDISVTGVNSNEGIRKYQGNFRDSLVSDPAGNLFSNIPNEPNYWSINNQVARIEYLHHKATPSFNVVPSNVTNNVFLVASKFPYSPIESCPNPTGSIEESKSTLALETNSQVIITDTLSRVFNRLIDIGNTQELIQTISTAYPDEGPEVTGVILSGSPYISDTVIHKAIIKEEVLTNPMIRDIMVSNGHSGKSEVLLSAIDNRIIPMPDYMFNEILASSDSISLKELLEANISFNSARRDGLFNQLVNLYSLEAMNSDTIVQLLDTLNTVQSKLLLIQRYIDQGKIDFANQTAVEIVNYGIDESESEELLWLLNLLDQYGCIDSIPTNQLSYPNFTNRQIEAYIRNILIDREEINYLEPFIFPNSLKSQQVNHRKLRPAKSEEILNLKVYPNPTKGIFTIEYKLDDTAVKGYLRITDLKGSILGLKELTKNQDKLEMNIDKFPSGKYLIELWSEAGRIEGKIIVKM